jgi:hypothetical protein
MLTQVVGEFLDLPSSSFHCKGSIQYVLTIDPSDPRSQIKTHFPQHYKLPISTIGTTGISSTLEEFH